MTINEERTQDTRAERRIGQPFRRHGGAFSRGSPDDLHIEPDARGDQSNNDGSGLQWSTPYASCACRFRGISAIFRALPR